MLYIIIPVLETCFREFNQLLDNHESKHNIVEYETTNKVELILKNQDYQMTEDELGEFIFAMENYLKIIHKTSEGYCITFYNEKNPHYELSGLHEIVLVDPITEYQLNILEKIGGDTIKLYVEDCESNFRTFEFLVEREFPKRIAIDIEEMSDILVRFIQVLNLEELSVSVKKIDFYCFKALLMIRCSSFEFIIQDLIDIHDRIAEIPIFSECMQIIIVLENVFFDQQHRVQNEEHEPLQVILKIDPPSSHEWYCFELPDFFEPEFGRSTELHSCSLLLNNLAHANQILNSFTGLTKLDLNLENVDELYSLSNNPQMSNLETLKLKVIQALIIHPEEVAHSLSLLKNLRVLHLNLYFEFRSEIPSTVYLQKIVFNNLEKFHLITNKHGVKLLDLCQSKNTGIEKTLVIHHAFPENIVLPQINKTKLVLQSITCDNDWNMLLSCPYLGALTILEPLNFHLTQNTQNMTLMELSISFYPESLTNTVFNLPKLRKLKIELLQSHFNEDLNLIHLQACHFFCQNIANKMERALRVLEIIDNIGLDPIIFILFRFEKLKHFYYDHDLMSPRTFDFYVEYFFKNTLSKRDATILLKSNACERGIRWRIDK